jgi:hypothetical protein
LKELNLENSLLMVIEDSRSWRDQAKKNMWLMYRMT